ncbi:MAG: hypothetical protein EP321_00090 [Sphingomonadales bacterium]|nr:MAG: hypothetical protein EP345_12185 [Sphingomonadales bacterium]TNF06407.1 MAG: hypothetical protein EP321_00090 [Sphingomonadales bacterium]
MSLVGPCWDANSTSPMRLSALRLRHRTNPDGASNWLLRGCSGLPASVNGISVVALDVSGLHQCIPCLKAVALHHPCAPVLSAVGLATLIAVVIANVSLLTGPVSLLVQALPWVLPPAAGIAGTLYAYWLSKHRPEVYARLERNFE